MLSWMTTLPCQRRPHFTTRSIRGLHRTPVQPHLTRLIRLSTSRVCQTVYFYFDDTDQPQQPLIPVSTSTRYRFSTTMAVLNLTLTVTHIMPISPSTVIPVFSSPQLVSATMGTSFFGTTPSKISVLTSFPRKIVKPRTGCSQIPKLRVACASGLNGQRTMWSFCEQCGAISMVESD